ncbi:ribonuclease HII [Paenibacillus dendritiformis]|uniref:ribonuclease HII n=1 Tax=Paenibacillus dendritiformis TaxID=130049 RepID=UPI0036670F53
MEKLRRNQASEMQEEGKIMGQRKTVDAEAEAIDLTAWEKRLWEEGLQYVAGIDEVGRGCLFGDVVAAAVILPAGVVIDGINDSKKLSAKKREALYEEITECAIAWSVAQVDASTIDRINIKQASRLAMKQAVQGLGVRPDMLLIDAERIDCPLPQEAIVKGDANSQSIAVASIVAKVTRDRLCAGLWDEMYPDYGIAVHKGYATKLHREQLEQLGPTPMHRKSFLKSLFPEEEQLSLF